MLKRKRGQHDGGKGEPAKEVEAKIVHGKKLLNKALKLGKNFERQKLDKRIKIAQKDEPTKVGRLQEEAEALKTLDISTAVNTHLYKTLLKTKTIVESKLLPSFVTLDVKKPDGAEQDVLAVSNVTARLYNTKPVKEAMTQIMRSVYAAIGVPNPAIKSKSDQRASKNQGAMTEKDVKSKRGATVGAPAQDRDEPESEVAEDPETEPEALVSGSEMDTHYRSRLASSSEDEDEDDDGEEESLGKSRSSTKKLRTLDTRDLSITPEPSDAESESESESQASQSPMPVPKKKRDSKPEPTRGGSTFLPTLMGGYLSGDESATDNDDVAPPPRKNRRGQRARREIWEKKYGAKAAHLKKEAKDKPTNVIWDPKRGAVSAEDRAPRRGRNGFVRSREQVTGENAIPVASRTRDVAKSAEMERRDAKPLHPSWIAAKKAKEEKKAATFAGKKILFD